MNDIINLSAKHTFFFLKTYPVEKNTKIINSGDPRIFKTLYKKKTRLVLSINTLLSNRTVRTIHGISKLNKKNCIFYSTTTVHYIFNSLKSVQDTVSNIIIQHVRFNNTFH